MMASIKCNRCERVFDGHSVIMPNCERCGEFWCPECWEAEQVVIDDPDPREGGETGLCQECYAAKADEWEALLEAKVDTRKEREREDRLAAAEKWRWLAQRQATQEDDRP